jgi:hypothetical protein
MDVTRYGRVGEPGLVTVSGRLAYTAYSSGFLLLETFTSGGNKLYVMVGNVDGALSAVVTAISPEGLKAYISMTDMIRIGRVGEQSMLVVSAKEFNKPALVALETVNEGGDPLALYLWADGAGNLRGDTAIPTSQDEDGTIIIAGV